VKTIVSLDLPGVPRRRGRPPTGKAMSNAERQARYRANADIRSLTVQLPVDLLEKLDVYIKYRDTTKSAVIEKLLLSQLFRKR
jgi:hypothetical protein